MDKDECLKTVDFEELLGEHELSGCDFDSTNLSEKHGYRMSDSQVMRFRLDGKVYVAVEDPEDGYRSCMDSLLRTEDEIKNTFPPCAVIGRRRKNTEYEIMDAVELVNALTLKVVLVVGTGNSEDYYPYFLAEFNPEELTCNQQIGRSEGTT